MNCGVISVPGAKEGRTGEYGRTCRLGVQPLPARIVLTGNRVGSGVTKKIACTAANVN